MRLSKFFAAAAMLAAGVFASANASPLTYKLTGLFTGSIGGTPVGLGTITWTLTSDTSRLVTLGSGIVKAPALTDTIKVSGFGTLTASGASELLDEPSAGRDAFYITGLGTRIVFGAPALVGYVPSVSIGPVPVLIDSFNAVPTDKGDFIITGARLSFQAIAAPEPLTLALFGAGLAGLGVARRRQKA